MLLPVENVVSLVTMLEQAGSQTQLEERTGPQGRRDLNIRTEEESGMSSALAERVRKWGDELNQQWLEKGIRQGRREGIRQGRREGIRQGRREGVRLILRLAGRRFGSPVAERLAPLLNELSDPGRLAAVADAVIECETAEELLARAEES